MTRFRLRLRQSGAHTLLTLYAGAAGQGANCGSLTLRPDEADAFLAAIQTGSVGPADSGADVEVVSDRDTAPEVAPKEDDHG